MLNTTTWTGELSFLNQINSDRSIEYRKSPALKVPYEANFWILKFRSRSAISIDFNVELEDGSLLTHSKNQALLDIFKCWICIQTHPDVTGGIVYKALTSEVATRRIITILDYFLMHSDYFKLAKYGFENISENDLIMLLSELATKNEITESIYRWRDRLSSFLRAEIEKLGRSKLLEVINTNPILREDIPDIPDRMLDLSDEEIILSRGILWEGNFYVSRNSLNSKNYTYRYSPNIKKITDLIYAHTLKGRHNKPVPLELRLSPYENHSKEYPSVPVRDTGAEFNESEWAAYRSTIYSFVYLKEVFTQIPAQPFAFSAQISKHNFQLASSKRFKTIPPKIVLDALRYALEFSLEYGEDILESALSIISFATKSNVSSLKSIENISDHVTPKVRSMGVKVWHLGKHMHRPGEQGCHIEGSQSSSLYFNCLRGNKGLYELVRILFGAIQFCIGTLMARRQSELIELISGRALNESKTHLIFLNRKTGYMELREKEARPLPAVAVKLIQILENFHRKLSTILETTGEINLFAHPGMFSGKPMRLGPTDYNVNLNLFCDYIEVAQNDLGQRYYFRQHQLRRFFAMTFFWANAFGGMDTLRWFLGHTDVEHLYQYITESTPGNVLRASKAFYGKEVLKTDSTKNLELEDIVEKRFGTRNFRILDDNELTEFIEDLLSEDKLEIEPIFFNGPEGKAYRIAIKVKQTDGE